MRLLCKLGFHDWRRDKAPDYDNLKCKKCGHAIQYKPR